MVIEEKDIFSVSFGIIIIYLNYVKSRYAVMVTMYTQGLKSFAHVLARCFLLTNISQLYQKKNQTNTYIDIDELKIFKYFFYDKTPFETEIENITKTKDKVMLDKMNNKISIINETSTILVEIKDELNKNIKLIYESMCELQDEIYSDDSLLTLAELNKIDAIIDDGSNVT